MKVNEKRLNAMIMDAHAHEGKITKTWVEKYLDELVKRNEIADDEKNEYTLEFADWVIVH